MPLYAPSGGGSGGSAAGAAYKSGVAYQAIPINAIGGTGLINANEDWLIPFIPRAPLTVAEVFFSRIASTASNTYVGIYSFAGTLLTNCAVSTGTSVGSYAVSTTPVALTAGETYFIAINQSGAVVRGDVLANNDVEPAPYLNLVGINLDMGGTLTSINSPAYYKARTNAALLSSLTMTGWANANTVPHCGFIPQ